MHKFLSETERLGLERFNADVYAMEAVKKVILWRIYRDGVLEEDLFVHDSFSFNTLLATSLTILNSVLTSLEIFERASAMSIGSTTKLRP